jgi:hypothetical protein
MGVWLGLVAWAGQDDFNGMTRIERPPLMGVGRAVVDGTKTMQWIERPPREGVGTVVEGPVFLQEFEGPDPDDLFNLGIMVKWKFRINAHVYGAATIWECPGDRQPPDPLCSSVRSPAEINRCGQGGNQFWAYPFNSAMCCVPCGGPFPTVTLTYWRQDYAGFEPARLYQAVIVDHPDGSCSNYNTTATLSPSYCPSPTPTPSPSPSPSPTPTPTPTPTATPALSCPPNYTPAPCTTPPPGYHGGDWRCCPEGSWCVWCWDPNGQLYYQCCCTQNWCF